MDWIAAIFELYGGWRVGNYERIGFIFTLIGCLIWIYVAINYQIYGLLAVVIPAIIINIRNYIKWGKNKD